MMAATEDKEYTLIVFNKSGENNIYTGWSKEKIEKYLKSNKDLIDVEYFHKWGLESTQFDVIFQSGFPRLKDGFNKLVLILEGDPIQVCKEIKEFEYKLPE
jgi:hypothetical protein